MKANLKMQRGFTLIEVIIVIATLALLVGVVSLLLQAVQLKTETSDALDSLKQIANHIEMYKTRHGTYPLSCGTGGQWASYNSAYGCNLGVCWISQFSGEGWCPLSHNLNFPPPGYATNQSQYIYMTDVTGTNYKLLYHAPVSMAVPPEFIDPARPTWAFGIWSSGGTGF